MRAVRFFRAIRCDVIKQEEVIAAMHLPLTDPDMADLAVEDLRRWRHWEAADRVLALWDEEGFDIPIIRRAILRYALQCSKPIARDFVERQRQLDAEKVNDAEEILKLEAPVIPHIPLVILPVSASNRQGGTLR